LTRFVFKAGLLLLCCSCASLSQTAERLSLSDAIVLAHRNNPDVLRAQKEIEAAEGRILQAGRIPNPELSVAWNESPNVFNFRNANERDISLSQQIEFPTKRSTRIDVASLDKELAQLNLERTKLLVTARVKQSYYSLLFSEKIIEGLEEQLKHLKDFQQLLTGRYQAGDNNYLDVIRAKVEITRLNNDIADARRERRVRQHQLNITIGRDAGEFLSLADTLSHTPWSFPEFFGTSTQDSLLESLTQKSFTMKIAQLSVNRQLAAGELAKTSYLPDFGIGLTNQKRAEVNNLWGVEFRMSVPLWFWQEPKGQIEEAMALSDIATGHQTAVARRVRACILNALDLLQVAETQLRAFDESLLMDAQDILSTAITRYQNNQIDVLNLLDVYRTYRAAKFEYVRALHNHAIAVAELESAAELPSEQ
jgi:outer membrane protein, heavy metal efflux system